MTQKFGELFREERQRAEKRIGEVAQRLRVSLTYLSDVERGTRPPLSSERIRDAAQFMKLSDGRLTALLAAAAAQQGSFELPAPTSSKGREAGAALQRAWGSLDDETFDQIVGLMREKGK